MEWRNFNFLSQGQIESLSLDNFCIQNITMMWVFFGNFIFAIIVQMFSGKSSWEQWKKELYL